ncbi:MAG TPA: hypothetical protein VFY27_00385, partial [Woeseiaceae bacterium]|nr:hypothetical protein [Woeseiaceae bacterium]
MAHPSSLVAGNCYFLVHYYDRDLLVPNVSTLVFRESRVDEETGHRLWLFDEPTSSAEVSDAGGSIAVGLPDS